MFGGVIGSLPGLDPPVESSVRMSKSPLCPLEERVGARVPLAYDAAGVSRPVGSDFENSGLD